jgi:hypothetical protein
MGASSDLVNRPADLRVREYGPNLEAQNTKLQKVIAALRKKLNAKPV